MGGFMKKIVLGGLVGLVGIGGSTLFSLGEKQVVAAENNAVTDEIYDNFDLDLNPPAAFTSEDVAENAPLSGYQTSSLSELYVSWMNMDEQHFEGRSRFLETQSASLEKTASLKLVNESQWPNAKGLGDWTHVDFMNENFEYQFNNGISFKGEKDAPPLVLQNFIGAGKYNDIENNPQYNDTTEYSKMMFQVFRRNKYTSNYSLARYDGGGVSRHKIHLADSKTTAKKNDMENVDSDRVSGLNAMTAGDFNGDGVEEVAVYLPSTCGETGHYQGPTILFVGYKKDRGFVELTEKDGLPPIKLASLGGNKAQNLFGSEATALAWNQLPLVQLTTSSLAKNPQDGKDFTTNADDLVISLSASPDRNVDVDVEGSWLSIHSIYKQGEKQKKMAEVYATQFHGMQFTSAEEGDLNGDTVKELLVGGTNKDGNKNLIQLISYEKNSVASKGKEWGYQSIFNNSVGGAKEIATHTVGDVGKTKKILNLKQPIPLAVGNYHQNTLRESAFIGGRIVDINPGTLGVDEQKSQAVIFKEASFMSDPATGQLQLVANQKDSQNLTNPYIRSAYFMRISAKEPREQLVTVIGRRASSISDSLGITFSWEKDGKMHTNYENESLIKAGDRNGNGTFLTAVPIDIDEDQLQYSYEGKECSWSKPQIAAIVQANPYWKELSRHADASPMGTTDFVMTSGSGKGTKGSWNAGVKADASTTVGIKTNFIIAEADFSMSINAELLAQYIGESSKMQTKIESRRFSFPAEDSVVMLSQPVVTYRYKFIVPDELKTKDSDPTEEELVIPVQHPATYSGLSLKSYHGAQKKANELLEEKEHYPEIDMNQVLGVSNYETGDPTTYQRIGGESAIPVQTKDKKKTAFHDANQEILVNNNGKSDQYSLKISNEQADSHGFNIQLALGAKFHFESQEGIFVKFVQKVDLGVALQGGYSQLWTDMSFDETEFDFTYPSLYSPDEAIFQETTVGKSKIEDYFFTVKPAVWRTSVVNNGLSEAEKQDQLDAGGEALDDHPIVLGHLVKTNADSDVDSFAPKPPTKFHVKHVATTAVQLAWTKEVGQRQGTEHELFQQVGDQYKLIGKTSDDHYSVADLKPGQEYRFKIRSVSYDANNNKKCSPLQPIATEANQLDGALVVKTLTDNSVMELNEFENVLASVGEKLELVGSLKDTSVTDVDFDWNYYQEASDSYNGSWVAIEEKAAPDLEALLPYQTKGNLTFEKLRQLDSGRYRLKAVAKNNSDFAFTSLKLNVTEEGLRKALVDPNQPVVSLENQEEEPGQVIAIEDENEGYYLNNRQEVTVKGQLSKEGTHGEMAFYLYDEVGREVLQTERIPVINQSATYKIADFPEGSVNVVAVYFDETTPDGTASIARPVYDQEITELMSFEPVKSEVKEVQNQEVQTYAVNYRLNGGTNHPDNPTRQDPKVGLALQAPTRLGYKFLGWYYQDENAEFTKDATDRLVGYEKDLVLEAKWEIKNFNIFYQSGLWKNPESNPRTFTIEQLKVAALKIQRPIFKNQLIGEWFADFQTTERFKNLSTAQLGNVFLHTEEVALDEPVNPAEPKPEPEPEAVTPVEKESSEPAVNPNSPEKDKESEEKNQVAGTQTSRKNLPKTNTVVENMLLLGIGFILLAVVLFWKSRKQKQ